MKTTREFLADLAQQNIRLWADGDQLRLRAPEGALTGDLIPQLQARKAEILDFLRQTAQKIDRPPIEPVPRREPLPMSYAQQRLWFLDQLEGPSSTYNIPLVHRLSGILHIAALQQALNDIVRRHEVLRTTFPTLRGEPVQQIAPDSTLPLEVVNLQHLAETDQAATLNRLLTQAAEQPFDLAQGPLLRAILYVISNTEHVLLINKHHIISDGWSLGIWWRELDSLYRAFSAGKPSPLPDLSLQYADFAQWQRQWLSGEVLEKQLAYWQQQLADAPTLLELPTDHPRPAVQTFNGQTARFEIASPLAEQLRDLSRTSGASLFMTLYAAFAVLLSRYSGQTDIVVGTSIANRNYQELEPLIGFFVNTLALRADLSDSPRFDALLQHVRQVTLDAYAHQDIPFEQLAEELRVERNLSHPPLFQVMFELESAFSEPAVLGDLQVTPLELENVTAKFDLNVMMYEVDPASSGGLRGEFEYNTDLFEPATISRMIGHYQQLLTGIVADPAQSINELPLLTEAERRQLLVEWNDTYAACPTDRCFHQLFEAQVERTPGAVAIVYNQAPASQMTYRELNERANHLAHHLRTLGVRPEKVAGVCMERGPEVLISLLAIFKAGGVYMPLDPALPAERLDFMLTNSEALVILTQAAHAAKLSSQPAHIICLDADWELIARQPASNPVNESTPKNLAYVIYTSGSTGIPKGAMVEQQGMVNHLYTKIFDLNLTQTDRVAEIAPLSFDISIWQFLSALLVGGSVHIFDDETVRNPDQLLNLTESQHITVLEVVPSLLRFMLDDLTARGTERPAFSTLRWLLLTGEALPPHLCQEWFNHYPGIPLMNAYGPTECSDDVTHHPIYEPLPPQAITVPIGRAVANMRLYILDAHMQPTPIGVPGELYVGGIGVGRGYLNDPERTAAALMSDPFVPGPEARFYKTGDLVRYRPDGTIEFLGRLDYQVKIRGHRIELGEIETTLADHPDVRQTLVVAHEKAASDYALVAYLAPRTEPALSVTELRHYLSQTLPDYMIPAHFVCLPDFPLTPNGKIDRRALPIPEETDLDEGYVAPRTPTEDVLAAIWTEVLELERVGRHSNFFELGGHSLLATRVISRVRDSFQVELSVRTVFEASTVAALAVAVETARQAGNPLPVPPPIQPITRHGDLPLSFAQQRLWFIDQLAGSNAIYNIPLAYCLTGVPQEHALQQAIDELVQRHEVLRTTFPSELGQPIQYIHPDLTVPLTVIDFQQLSNTSEAEQAAQLHQLLNNEADRPFDLAQGPLLRVTLYVCSDTASVLLVNIHHIISDDWSIDILMRELDSLYQAAVKGVSAQLPALPVQYADFAQWQRQWFKDTVLEKQLTYWQGQLASIPAQLSLPTDHPRPSMQTFNGQIERFELDADLTQQLRTLSRQSGASLFMTLYAVYAVLLSRYSGQEDLGVGTPIANRQYHEVESLIGFFLNTLVLRTDLSSNPSFVDLLKQVRQVTLEAYTHQDIPLEQLVDELVIERDLSHPPLFQVMFAWLEHAQPTALGELEMSPLSLSGVTARYELTLILGAMAAEGDSGLWGMIEYNTDLFEASTIERMVGHFQQLLLAIVDDPTQPIQTLPMLTQAERHQLLVEWNDTQIDYPKTQLVHQLIEAQAEQHPLAPAVVYPAPGPNTALTYGELNQRANQLAHYLRSLGVGPEVIVAVYMERSLDTLVSYLAILKAGGAYTPIDATYPAERVAFILDDTQSPVLLTHSHLAQTLATTSAHIVCLDRDWPCINQESQANPDNLASLETLAYVIYTSGSTGQPKGSQIAHQSLLNFIFWYQRVMQIEARDRIPQFAGTSFDVSVSDIWPCLATGAALYLPRFDLLHDPQRLQEWIVTNCITKGCIVTPVAENLLGLEWPPETAMSICMTGGEQLRRVPAHHHPFTFFNAYGPSECTIMSVYCLVPPNDKTELIPPIGRPVANTELYILDQHLQPVPIGVYGELFIGGECLGRGYLNRSALTEERFIPHPFSEVPEARLYRTGDLVRYLPSGEIAFLGRSDDQVKLRGYRIELGEIETVLAAHPQVQSATVLVWESDEMAGDKRLLAYLVAEEEAAPTAEVLRGYLKGQLPAYMVPSGFVQLESMPLTPNGKVDRRALPAPEWRELEEGYISPRTPTESVLEAIWAEVLGLERVSRHDNFFDLGGHSLLATQIISRIREAFQIALPVRTIFEAFAIADLAEAIETTRQAEQQLPVPPPIQAVEHAGDLPLSFAQQRLWFLNQMTGPNPTYSLPMILPLSGSLQVNALEQALSEIVRRHDILRATFPAVEGKPVQRVVPNLTLPLPVVDLQPLVGPQQMNALNQQLSAEAVQDFDLAHGPLLRTSLYVLNRQEHVLFLNMHHIIADGWSLGVLWQELDSLYWAFTAGQPSPLPELSLQYADFAQWQRQWLQGDVLDKQLTYWRQQLADAPTLLELPTDRPRPGVQTFNGQTQLFEIEPSLADQLRRLSRRSGTSLFMILYGAFSVLLSRYSGQEDVVIGTLIANRHYQEIEPLIGFFVNTLPLRADLSGNPSFEDLLTRVRQVTLDAYAHQDIPFEQLVGELAVERHLSHTPLFQVVFMWQNMPLKSDGLGDLAASFLELDTVTAKFDLTLVLGEHDAEDSSSTTAGLWGGIEYNTDLFEASTIERMIGHFQQLLLAIVDDPTQPVQTLPMLTQAERHQLLVEWNDTQIDYPKTQLVHQLIEAQVEQNPRAPAVVYPAPGPNTSLTYGELNQRANQLAHYLRSLGVGPEVIVAVYMERSLDTLMSYLAILKAGGAYTPIDATYPAERVAFILDDTQSPVLLTHSHLAQTLSTTSCQVLCLDRDWSRIKQQSQANPENLASLETLAYVIYTSGSTGQPKGSQIPHQSLLNLIFWYQQVMQIEASDRIPQFAGTSFDVSVSDIWPCLATGAALYLPRFELLHDPQRLQEWIVTNCITKGCIVTPVAENLLALEWPPETPMSICMTGGEQLRRAPAHHHPFTFFNAYGPSECTVISVYCLVPPNDKTDLIPPIGRPVANTELYILDQHLQPVPIGVYGELCIGGVCLGRGYLNRPALTEERFIPHPFSEVPGARLYRTGDLVRYLPSGDIEFLGRSDDQVKLRGYRIELGEIETVLAAHPQVQSATVLVWESDEMAGDKRLLAYLVPEGAEAPTAESLRGYLKAQLPEYMVPSGFVQLESMPLTPNGKVDRRALPTPDQIQPTLNENYVSPQTDLEKTLATVWQACLNLEKVGIHDNFFEVGGHSLLAIQLHTELRAGLAQDVSITDLFHYPTIASLAQYLSQTQPEPSGRQPNQNRAQARRAAIKQRATHQPNSRNRSRNSG